MNAAHVILKFLGFGRPPPKTRAGRLLRIFDRGAGVLALAYLGLMLFPQLLFSYSFHHDGITLYASEPIPDAASGVLNDARAKLNSSGLLEKDDLFRVFLCDSKAKFWLLSPLARSGFATSYPLTDNIIVAKGDVSANTAGTYRTTNTRKLSDVITHECGHVLIARRFGRHCAYVKPTWVQEGYCEHLAGSSTVSEDRGDAWIRGEWQADGVPLDYHQWRRMVEYLITQEKKGIQQLIRTPPKYSDIVAKMRNWMAHNKTMPNKTDAGDGR